MKDPQRLAEEQRDRFISAIQETDLFDGPYSIGFYTLKDTGYMIYVYATGYRWYMFVTDEGRYKPNEYVTFGHVFNSVDNETRRKLAYHLDLFL